jgi:hypothetical protein
MALHHNELRKLAAILARLGSPHDGEIVCAGRLATDLINRAGTTWEDLLNAPDYERDWRACAEECARSDCKFISDWEREFLQSLLADYYQLTEKQERVLRKIAGKARVRAWPPTTPARMEMVPPIRSLRPQHV